MCLERVELVKKPDVVLIAGPTASGKSKMALELANRYDGEIINTDSMQIYPVLDVLTARPEAEDLTIVPHHLYGFARLDESYSVAKWLNAVEPLLADLKLRKKTPVFVGGTGLYFTALLEGLTPVPEIPTEIRQRVRRDLIENGAQDLYGELAECDAEYAANLRPSDGQRIARALEVVLATGKSLATFQKMGNSTPLVGNENIQKLLILPPRNVLHERINLRAEIMKNSFIVEEVKALLALDLPADSTVLRAIGVSQLESYIHGKESLDDAITRIKAATRQYSKRQSTWFNNQFGSDWEKITSL